MRRVALPVVVLYAAHALLDPLPARADPNVSAAETESTAYTTVSVGLVLGVTAVVTVVVVVVVLVQKGRFPRAEDPIALGLPSPVGPGAPPELVGEGLVVQGVYGGDGALSAVLADLVERPGAMDEVTREAATGGGGRIDALSRASGAPADEVARAWLAAAGEPVATREAAFAAMVRFVERLGPRLAPDAAAAADLLDALADEQAHPDRPAPARARVAAWAGVPEGSVGVAVDEVLGELGATDRASRHALALEGVRALGARLGREHPELVLARLGALVDQAVTLGVRPEIVAQVAGP